MAPIDAVLKPLTDREREVLERLVSGMTQKTIANDLLIDVGAVELHYRHIKSKIGATSLAELVGIALTAGVRLDRNSR